MARKKAPEIEFSTIHAERAYQALRNAAHDLREAGDRQSAKAADEIADHVIDEHGIPPEDQ